MHSALACRYRGLVLLLAGGLWGCAPAADAPPADARPAGTAADSEATSLLGEPLFRAEIPADLLAQRERDLAAARAELDAAPGDAEAIIWVGRRLGYLNRFQEAIDTFGEGIRLHPDDARMYRHRGHRLLTVRELDRAIADFRTGTALVAGRPDEVEPDGQPNPLGIPTSTLQFNLWYHLALAHYVRGEFEEAKGALDECMKVSLNPDAQAATAYWSYLTLRRLGEDRAAEALLVPFDEGFAVIENGAYLDLLRLFRGDRTPEQLLGDAGAAATLQSTTTAYGVGAWHLVNGRDAEAADIFERITAATHQWSAFGYLAAEGERARAR